MRILIVEDNSLNFIVLQKILSSMLGNEHIIENAVDGDKAIYALNHHEPYDLIFMDSELPGNLDGESITKTARKLEQIKDNIHISTIITWTTTRVRGNDKPFEGADDIIDKPVQRFQLETILVKFNFFKVKTIAQPETPKVEKTSSDFLGFFKALFFSHESKTTPNQDDNTKNKLR